MLVKINKKMVINLDEVKTFSWHNPSGKKYFQIFFKFPRDGDSWDICFETEAKRDLAWDDLMRAVVEGKKYFDLDEYNWRADEFKEGLFSNASSDL